LIGDTVPLRRLPDVVDPLNQGPVLLNDPIEQVIGIELPELPMPQSVALIFFDRIEGDGRDLV